MAFPEPLAQWLAGKPIDARRSSPRQQRRRFATYGRILAAAGVAVFALLIPLVVLGLAALRAR
jgi:hypothetical protein